MGFTNTPNMSLPIPAVGNEPGPDYAVDVNNALTLVDSHDHSPGKGVLITPSGLNISANLPFNNNSAINLAGANFLAQGSTPSLNTVYVSGVDLFFVDGLGNDIRITQSGGVAGTPGSITNLIPPASATYVPSSKTFVWQSDVAKAANMDFASAIFRNITPNSTFGITMQAPASLGSNNTITLPLQPASKKIMTMTSAGTQAADTDVDNSTIVIASNIIKVPTGGITDNEIALNTITPDRLAFDVGLQSQEFQADGTWTRPAGVDWVIVFGCGGGSGGGGGAGGANDAGGGGGGSGAIPWITVVNVTGGNQTVVVGGGGAGGAATSVPGTAASGSPGNDSSFGSVTFQGASTVGAGGTGANAPTPGPGGSGAAGAFNIQEQSSAGGAGGTGPSSGTGGTGVSGQNSNYKPGGTGAAGSTQSGGGGGGGAGFGRGGNGGIGSVGSSGTGVAGGAANANTGAGGGGGGGRANAGGTGTGGAGGAGGSGFVNVYWIAVQ